MDPFPDEHELIGFFGVEPTLTDPNLPWTYNDVTFEVEVEGRPFKATVNVGNGDLDIRWGASDKAAVSLALREVQGLRVAREHGSEWLIADFRGTAALAPLRLQITPVFRMLWAAGNEL